MGPSIGWTTEILQKYSKRLKNNCIAEKRLIVGHKFIQDIKLTIKVFLSGKTCYELINKESINETAEKSTGEDKRDQTQVPKTLCIHNEGINKLLNNGSNSLKNDRVRCRVACLLSIFHVSNSKSTWMGVKLIEDV